MLVTVTIDPFVPFVRSTRLAVLGLGQIQLYRAPVQASARSVPWERLEVAVIATFILGRVVTLVKGAVLTGIIGSVAEAALGAIIAKAMSSEAR